MVSCKEKNTEIPFGPDYESLPEKKISRKTIWQTFESCNHYKIPETIPKMAAQIHYGYAKTRKRSGNEGLPI